MERSYYLFDYHSPTLLSALSVVPSLMSVANVSWNSLRVCKRGPSPGWCRDVANSRINVAGGADIRVPICSTGLDATHMYRFVDSMIRLLLDIRLGRQFPGKLSTRSSKSKFVGEARSGIVGGTFSICSLLSRSSPRCRVIARLSFRFISSSTNISLSRAQSIVLRRLTRDRDILELLATRILTGLVGCASGLFVFLSQSRFLFLIRVLGGVLPYSSKRAKGSSGEPPAGNCGPRMFLLW